MFTRCQRETNEPVDRLTLSLSLSLFSLFLCYTGKSKFDILLYIALQIPRIRILY